MAFGITILLTVFHWLLLICLNVEFRFFSSSTLSPVYEVCPSLNESATKEMPLIPLAYLAVPGEEHYDGIISIRDSTLFHSVIDKTCLI